MWSLGCLFVIAGGAFIDDNLNSDKNGGETSSTIPPEVLFYVMPYMNLQDILNMECVCKYLRQWVRNDILLWRKLHVEPPLSRKLRNRDLIELFKRTKGQLECLILVDCMMITEGIIRHIILSSPMLYKVRLPTFLFLYLPYESNLGLGIAPLLICDSYLLTLDVVLER